MTIGTKTGGRDATQGVIEGRFALSVGKPTRLPEPLGYAWTPLSKVARLESGHTPSRSTPEYWDGDIPWIGIRDATGNHGKTLRSTGQTISQAGLDNSSARLLPAGTVCLSRTASVGYVVQMGVPMATSQDFVNWVCGPDLSPEYLKYVLIGEQDSIRRFAHGTTHQTMYYPEAKALQALLPPRAVQDRVAAVLEALDDKIAVNAKLVETADNLAAALTRAALTRTQQRLGDIADLTMGSSPPGTSYNEAGQGTVFYQGVRDFGVRFPTNRVWTTEPARMASRGDTLVSVRAPVGRTNLASEQTCIGRGLAAVRSTTGHPMTLFHLLRDSADVWAPYEAGGTVFGSINKQQLTGLLVDSIDPQKAQALEEQLQGLEARVAAALVESERLSATRDVLLPPLMSGKLKVKDAERVVEEVV